MIKVENTEDKEWAINPTISTKESSGLGDFFSGKQTFIVPAKGSANYEVVYLPKTMTSRKVKKAGEEVETTIEELHQGSVFFPLPNGTALLYNLKGTATAPQAEGTITEAIQAKKQKNIIVKVDNWSKKTQRFEASWVLEGQNDPTVFIRGANTFDIAGDASKDYKLNFLALRAGAYKFTTTFKVKETGEYMFYNFQVNVSESTDVEKIALESSVRETVSYGVVIENPTKDDVKLTKSMFTFTNEYVEITPDEVTIKANDSREFQINYRPLIVSETATDVLLKTPSLGEFRYQLKLKGMAPTSQQSLAFKCGLG